MEITKNSTQPLFEQIKADITQKIQSGSWPSGSQIPTETDLMASYSVSRITIRRAVEELCKEGILTKKQGKGTFVQEKKIFRKLEHMISFSAACTSNGMHPSSYVVKRSVLQPDSAEIPECRELRNDSVIYIQRVRRANDIPIMIENNYYPYTPYSFLLTEPLNDSLYQLLETRNVFVGCSQNSYIDAVKASQETAFLLSVRPGDPVFILYTEVYDTHNHLIHAGVQQIAASRYRFCYENA